MSQTLSPPPDDHLALFFELAHKIAHARGLPSDAARDFAQSLQVRLLETDYALFRRFEGQSSLRTYLTVVVARLLKDWQNHTWGKWRPSAAALRLGPCAVRLERLVVRDGFTKREAIEIVRTEPGTPSSIELLDMADRLPSRSRRRMVSDALLCEIPGPGFEDPVALEEQRRIDRQIHSVLRAALSRLPDEDRRLIEARYAREVKLSVVARSMGADAKAVYRRCERVLKTLRSTLMSKGVTGPAHISTTVS